MSTVFSIWLCLCIGTIKSYSLGGIYPEGTIIRNVGDNINITCWIDLQNSEGKNSSSLSFYEGNKEVPRENIAVFNESSIVFMIRNATRMSKRYVCKQDGEYGLDYSFVHVGTPPVPVTDFECRSYDYECFICNFTVPENNLKQTTYNLSFTIQSQFVIGTGKNKQLVTTSFQVYDCPLTPTVGAYYCNMSLDNNLYRQVYEYYPFQLLSKNTLGNLTQEFLINHFDNVIPAKPELKITTITSNSVTFEWQILKFTHYAKKELEYETKILSLNDQKTWKKISMEEMNMTRVNRTAFRATLSGLEYAYTWYDIRMRMKVKTAKNDGTMWSDMFNATFRTNATRPDDPPNTDIGSFHVDLVNNVHLYWEALPPYKENGPNIQYVITEVKQNGQIVNYKPVELSLTSAKFKLIQAEYEFTIKSSNSLGLSDRGSTIRIPRKKFSEPQWLRKIYHQQKYSLSWTAPKNTRGLVDYTVFWCASKTESSDQCKGSIYFKHVSKEITNITHEEEGNSTMNFAVSANYEKFSSGMVWAMCTALKTSDFGKMKPMLSLSESTTIKIQWSLECVYSSILEGYHLVYCPIRDPAAPDPECKEPERNVTISKNAKEFAVQNLKPYTTYKFIMSMYSSEKQGPPSDPAVLATVETAPTPPRILKYTNLTSNSVTLMWNAPESLNGRLRYYEIIYNNEKIRVEGEGLSNVSQITYTLGSLRSFYNYKVYVIARTIEDSKPSNDIHFTTLIGMPGVVGKVNHTTDYSDVTFAWEPPAVPSGRLDYYEVKSVFLKGNDPEIELISKVNGTRCRLRLPACPDSSHSFQFSVRAVNAVDKDEMDYYTFSKRDVKEAKQYIDLDTITENDVIISRVAPIFKRHSHAEIDSVNDSHQLIHKENRIRHNRQERENTRNIHVTVQQKPSEDYVDDRLSLKCVEDNDPALRNWLETHSNNRRFLHGEWKALTSYVCNYTTDTKRKIMLVCGVLFAVSVILIFVYFGCQKYKRMKNIVVVFPPGLTDLDQDVHKGVDNMITKHDITRSDESLFKNENHHLLASSGNDSGYLHGIDCSDKSDGYDLSDPTREDEHSTQSDSVELSEISDSANASPTESPNVKRCEKTMPSVNNPIIVNGYVQQQTFQKPPECVFNGYTTLDAFGKPIIPAATPTDTDSKHKDLNPNGIKENICGYVTHKQLSEFGHRLQ